MTDNNKNTIIPTRPIGEIFEYDGSTYEVCECGGRAVSEYPYRDCSGCAFYRRIGKTCMRMIDYAQAHQKGIIKESMSVPGECCRTARTDRKDVIFKKTKKHNMKNIRVKKASPEFQLEILKAVINGKTIQEKIDGEWRDMMNIETIYNTDDFKWDDCEYRVKPCASKRIITFVRKKEPGAKWQEKTSIIATDSRMCGYEWRVIYAEISCETGEITDITYIDNPFGSDNYPFSRKIYDRQYTDFLIRESNSKYISANTVDSKERTRIMMSYYRDNAVVETRNLSGAEPDGGWTVFGEDEKNGWKWSACRYRIADPSSDFDGGDPADSAAADALVSNAVKAVFNENASFGNGEHGKTAHAVMRVRGSNGRWTEVNDLNSIDTKNYEYRILRYCSHGMVYVLEDPLAVDMFPMYQWTGNRTEERNREISNVITAYYLFGCEVEECPKMGADWVLCENEPEWHVAEIDYRVANDMESMNTCRRDMTPSERAAYDVMVSAQSVARSGNSPIGHVVFVRRPFGQPSGETSWGRFDFSDSDSIYLSDYEYRVLGYESSDMTVLLNVMNPEKPGIADCIYIGNAFDYCRITAAERTVVMNAYYLEGKDIDWRIENIESRRTGKPMTIWLSTEGHHNGEPRWDWYACVYEIHSDSHVTDDNLKISGNTINEMIRNQLYLRTDGNAGTDDKIPQDEREDTCGSPDREFDFSAYENTEPSAGSVGENPEGEDYDFDWKSLYNRMKKLYYETDSENSRLREEVRMLRKEIDIMKSDQHINDDRELRELRTALMTIIAPIVEDVIRARWEEAWKPHEIEEDPGRNEKSPDTVALND